MILVEILADASTLEPVVIAELQGISGRRGANVAGPSARASLSFQAWLMLGWACCTALLLGRLIRGLLVLALFVLLCGRPGDGLAIANNRLPSPRVGTLTPQATGSGPEALASYRPGMVWHRETQGRDRAKSARTSRKGRAVALALAYSPDGSTSAEPLGSPR